MKTKRNFLVLVLIIYPIFNCSNNEEDNIGNSCQKKQILLTEKQVISPTTNSSYFVGLTFSSIQANNTKIKVKTTVNSTQSTAIIEVENFNNTIGTQQLNSNPLGRIKYLGETYTTYYQPNGQSSYPIQPKGEIVINNINQECNTFSGTIFIQAYTVSNTLGEIRFSTKFDFENIPLNNEINQL